MNSESLTNVLTRQWRIVTGSKTVNPRNRMPETGASGSVGAPLEESGALPGNSLRPPRQARGPLYLFRFALLRRLLTAGFVRRGRGPMKARFERKYASAIFLRSGPAGSISDWR